MQVVFDVPINFHLPGCQGPSCAGIQSPGLIVGEAKVESQYGFRSFKAGVLRCQMKHQLMKCLQCDSRDLIENVSVVTRHEGVRSVRLENYLDPDALIFKKPMVAPLKAKVCACCGFVMMFANTVEVHALRKGRGLPT